MSDLIPICDGSGVRVIVHLEGKEMVTAEICLGCPKCLPCNLCNGSFIYPPGSVALCYQCEGRGVQIHGS